MDLNTLRDAAPWDWPEGTDKMLLDILRDDQLAESDRVLAAELAGNYTVINDELSDALLAIVRSRDATEALRSEAAISLGPVLEDADTQGFEDADEVPISEPTFHRIQESLRALYRDTAVPEAVRRQILEASVRAPQDWHRDAVRTALSSGSEAWKLTAVFCMRFLRGFDEQILEALNSKSPSIYYQALQAAGNWGVDAAWPHVAALVNSKRTDKPLLLAAIEAAAGIRPQEAPGLLSHLFASRDEDVVEAVHEAIAMAEGLSDEYDEEDGEEDEDDDRLR